MQDLPDQLGLADEELAATREKNCPLDQLVEQRIVFHEFRRLLTIEGPDVKVHVMILAH